MVPPAGFSFVAPFASHATGTTFIVRGGGSNEQRVCKRLSPRARRNVESVDSIRREATILRALAGRGAPRLIEAGEDADGPFVILERLAMSTLGEHGARGRPADARWIAGAARLLFERAAAMHEAKDVRGPLDILHADLSPENMLVADGAEGAALIDFGLAHYRDGAPPRDGSFRGTLAYAAPEAARGEPLDPRADLFALAASLLEARCGVAPRRERSPTSLLVAAAERPIDAWAERAAAGLAEPLGTLLRRAVTFQREDRPPSARAIVELLGRGT